MKKIILLVLFIAISASGCALLSASSDPVLGLEEAKTKIVSFINTSLMQPGQEVSVKEIVEENGLYKVTVNMSSGQEIISYMTKDGKLFFPQVMDVAETEAKAQEEAAAPASQATADVPKADKAQVELYVMSHCPYGTQIVKGILPVLETLGDDLDFDIKFCDYAMHGKKELDEQLNQYCIQENEPQKLLAYLYCFLEADKGEECLDKVGINKTKLNACVAKTDSQYKVTELFNDKSTWKSGRFPQFNVDQADNQKYGITGSPGLVINGEKISSARDSASLLKTICNGYNNPPESCATVLSVAPPSPGFGFSGTGSDTEADCGS